MPLNVDRHIAAPRLTRRVVLRASALAIAGALASRSAGSVTAKDTDPEDFTLPFGSSFVGQRIELGHQQYLWLIDSGVGATDVRRTLAPAFVAAGWTPVRVGLGTETWSRGHILSAVSQGSLGIGGFAHLVQVKSPPFSIGEPKR